MPRGRIGEVMRQLSQLWISMQDRCNSLLAGRDSRSACRTEKKEGIFRMNMMREVNYAAGSVISRPIYLPRGDWHPALLRREAELSNRVNAHNAASLATRVKNVGMRYQVRMIEDEKSGTKVHLTQGSESRRESSQLIGGGGQDVHRHAQTGDVVLVNRAAHPAQAEHPGPQLQGSQGGEDHQAHYANCSGYNTDFDGDEINIHLPQDQMSRAEAYTIMHSSENFARSTGQAHQGLIQDHVISSVYLTMQDTFLDLNTTSCWSEACHSEEERVLLLPPQ